MGLASGFAGFSGPPHRQRWRRPPPAHRARFRQPFRNAVQHLSLFSPCIPRGRSLAAGLLMRIAMSRPIPRAGLRHEWQLAHVRPCSGHSWRRSRDRPLRDPLRRPPPADLACIGIHELPRASPASCRRPSGEAGSSGHAELARSFPSRPYDPRLRAPLALERRGKATARENGNPGVLEVNGPALEETARFRTSLTRFPPSGGSEGRPRPTPIPPSRPCRPLSDRLPEAAPDPPGNQRR